MNKIFIIYFGFFLAACNYQVKDKSPEAQSEIPDTFSAHQITYQLVLEKVLTAKCLNCHSAAGGNRGQLNLEGYQNIFNKRDLIRDEVAGHSMPKTPTTPLTAAQLDLIIRWIDFGAQEFASPEPKVPIIPEPKVPIIPEPKVPTRPEPQVPIIPGPIPPEVGIPEPLTFQNVMDKVITLKCLKCHNANSRTDVDLVTYQDVRDRLSDIKADVISGEMPRKTTLTPEQKKLILDWIEAGAPK